MGEGRKQPVSRRSLLKMIGTFAGSTAMYNAMTELGLAQESGYSGPVQPATLFGGRLTSKLVEEQGITPRLIRFAAGIENTEDLLADIEQALA